MINHYELIIDQLLLQCEDSVLYDSNVSIIDKNCYNISLLDYNDNDNINFDESITQDVFSYDKFHCYNEGITDYSFHFKNNYFDQMNYNLLNVTCTHESSSVSQKFPVTESSYNSAESNDLDYGHIFVDPEGDSDSGHSIIHTSSTNNYSNINNIDIQYSQLHDNNWDSNQDKQFGFLPEQFQQHRTTGFPSKFVIKNFSDYMKAWGLVRDTGQPNYKAAKIVVPSCFNIQYFQKFLVAYHDKKLLDYLTYGFPLSVDKTFQPRLLQYNHSSANAYPSCIDQYIETEIQNGAMFGPFVEPPFKQFHVSPMLTRPKDGTKRRVIVDLSWEGSASINAHATACYDATAYKLTYPSIDVIAERVVDIGKDALIYKIDLRRAFRNLPVDPGDINLLGLYWDQRYYADVAVPFGWVHGSCCCQRLTDAIRYICNQRGFFLFNFSDDLIGCEKADRAVTAFKFLQAFLGTLGLPISIEKIAGPTPIVTCIGISVNAALATLSVPEDKLHDINILCKQWQAKSSVTRTQLQRLLGKLLYISKVVRYARMFMGRMLSLLRAHHAKRTIVLNQDFFRDLAWFNAFLPQFNGIVLIKRQATGAITLDASPYGLGARFGNEVYAYALCDRDVNNLSIIHLEMLNVLVALRCWEERLANTVVDIWCDNLGVVQSLSHFRIRDPFLMACARNIWLVAARSNIEFNVKHISGKSNRIADILSRWYVGININNEEREFFMQCKWYSITSDFLYIDYDI